MLFKDRLQIGHVSFSFSHDSTHSYRHQFAKLERSYTSLNWTTGLRTEWNLWKHGKEVIISPVSYSDRQIIHSLSSSPSVHSPHVGAPSSSAAAWPAGAWYGYFGSMLISMEGVPLGRARRWARSCMSKTRSGRADVGTKARTDLSQLSGYLLQEQGFAAAADQRCISGHTGRQHNYALTTSTCRPARACSCRSICRKCHLPPRTGTGELRVQLAEIYARPVADPQIGATRTSEHRRSGRGHQMGVAYRTHTSMPTRRLGTALRRRRRRSSRRCISGSGAGKSPRAAPPAAAAAATAAAAAAVSHLL
jgi:hypothetical protein